MKTVSLTKGAFNRVQVAGKSYFSFERDGQYSIIPSECPHRGGPLHLGSRSACKARLVCPWHDQQYPHSLLERRGLPVVTRGEQINFVVDDENPRIWKEYLPHLNAGAVS